MRPINRSGDYKDDNDAKSTSKKEGRRSKRRSRLAPKNTTLSSELRSTNKPFSYGKIFNENLQINEDGANADRDNSVLTQSKGNSDDRAKEGDKTQEEIQQDEDGLAKSKSQNILALNFDKQAQVRQLRAGQKATTARQGENVGPGSVTKYK